MPNLFKKSFPIPYDDVCTYPTRLKAMEAISRYCDGNGDSYTFTGDDEVEINGIRYEICRGQEALGRGCYGIKCRER